MKREEAKAKFIERTCRLRHFRELDSPGLVINSEIALIKKTLPYLVVDDLMDAMMNFEANYADYVQDIINAPDFNETPGSDRRDGAVMTIREQRLLALQIGPADFWFCPNTNKIIEGMKHDDKVICGCSKANPKCPEEPVQGVVHHVKRHLTQATVEQYMDQEETRRGR